MCSHIARDEQPWLTISRELVRNAIARGRKLRLTREWQEWHPPEGDGMGLQSSKVTTDKELRELTILSSQQRLYGRQAAAHRWAAFSGTSEPVPPLGWLACSRLGRLARPPLGRLARPPSLRTTCVQSEPEPLACALPKASKYTTVQHFHLLLFATKTQLSTWYAPKIKPTPLARRANDFALFLFSTISINFLKTTAMFLNIYFKDNVISSLSWSRRVPTIHPRYSTTVLDVNIWINRDIKAIKSRRSKNVTVFAVLHPCKKVI